MHDVLLTNQDDLRFDDLVTYATRLGLELDRFRADLIRHRFTARVAQNIDSADLSGVSALVLRIAGRSLAMSGGLGDQLRFPER